jgi:uncharacterized damage-inducible protein DinB
MRDHFLQLARYNEWANARIYAAAASFDDAERRRDVGAFFGSLQGTLGHILVADQFWLARLQHNEPPHQSLDTSPHESFLALHEARGSQDQVIHDFIATFDDQQIAEDFEYRDMAGNPHTLPRRIILTHMFNHATHHRGQAHQILRQLGMDQPPPLDLPYYVLKLC